MIEKRYIVGWSRVNGRWEEMVQNPQVHTDPAPIPPQLALEDVAARLNALEDALLPFAYIAKLCNDYGWSMLKKEHFERAWQEVNK